LIVGHYAPALVGKAVEPRVPLWALLLAVQLVDVAWAVLVLLGFERVRLDPGLPSNPLVLEHMPYTHGLAATAAWAGATYLATRRVWGTRGALVLAAAVASHWLCDLLVHRPDLPLLWGEPRLGLGLWNVPWAAFALEAGLLLGAAWWCARNGAVARPRRLLGFAVALAILQGILMLDEPADDVRSTVVAALVLFLLVAAAGAWIERDGEGAAPPLAK
jgi:hypothetical protein